MIFKLLKKSVKRHRDYMYLGIERDKIINEMLFNEVYCFINLFTHKYLYMDEDGEVYEDEK